MFQFTREFIINDNNGRLAEVKQEGTTLVAADSKFGFDGKYIVIDGCGALDPKKIVSAYKTVGSAAVPEVFAIANTGSPIPSEIGTSTEDMYLDAGDVVRFKLTLGQEGRVSSLYNDYYPEHTRDFLYEVKVETAAALPLEKVAAAMDKEKSMSDHIFFKHSYNAGTLTLTMPDEYTRVVGLTISKVPAARGANLGRILTGFKDYTPIVEWVRADMLSNGTITNPGKLGAGTTTYILNNMRLRSNANNDPFGYTMDERPLPNAIYTQYLIEYVDERRHIGSQVFGSINHSLASYVFFVLSNTTGNCDASAVDTDFDTMLNAAKVKVEITNGDDATLVTEVKDEEENTIATIYNNEVSSTVIPVNVAVLEKEEAPEGDTQE